MFENISITPEAQKAGIVSVKVLDKKKIPYLIVDLKSIDHNFFKSNGKEFWIRYKYINDTDDPNETILPSPS